MNTTTPQLPGYRDAEKIYTGVRTLVYRGIRESDGQAVILKFLRGESPTFTELAQFRNQYAIARNLDLPGVVRPLALETYQNSYVLVMPDEGYVSLQSSVISHQSSVSDFLNIGIQLAEILHGLYQHRVIHKDIKPANILIHPATQHVKLIDFSIASLLPKETQEIQNPNVLEGTLAYLSPEQTGRMNRGIDYRTDFYSLGVTFYELLTGFLPFESSDPMELVHCHIAKAPLTLQIFLDSEGNPNPEAISAIILKLMAKNAEDRYQSALGLKHDLEKCLQQWQENGIIEPFELGEQDRCDRFLIPEKLYGRDRAVTQLLAAFERVSHVQSTVNSQQSVDREEQSNPSLSASPRPLVPASSPTCDSLLPTPSPSPPSSELILVAGYSGVGKTAVIDEVRKPIARQRGYFIRGKFDQLQRTIPLGAFVQAFRNLMEQLLCESEGRLQQWRENILQALGENGQILIEVIPELEQIIGAQPSTPELSGSSAQNRFNFLFQSFIQVLATKEHPLVIFLDDLQWADAASLELMQLLIGESESSYLLVIGAYRNNEVRGAHPLLLTLEKIRQAQAKVSEICLEPLRQKDINQLIADTLCCSLDLAAPLTQLIYNKTQGNPFFTNQFLRSLYEDNLITFNRDEGYWQCDLSRLQTLFLADNVVELMALQLQKLSAPTQNILKLAACIGNQFDLQTLGIIAEQSLTEAAANLWPAIQEGLIVPQGQTYKFYHQGEEQSTAPNSPFASYKFLHDRVQQAAYSLISDERKQLTHLNIGELLLAHISLEKQEEKIFEIVNQLNVGTELMATRSQREEIARLNLRAGRKAKASTAYTAALQYFCTGIKLLPSNGWSHLSELTLTLYVSATEVAYLSGNFTAMEQLAQIVLEQRVAVLDKVAVYEIKIFSYMARNQPLQGLETALEILKYLGIELTQSPTKEEIEKEFQATATHFNQQSIEEAIAFPEMTDPTQLAAVRILAAVFPITYILGSNLMPLVSLKIANLSRLYGNTALSTVGYIGYGLILCSVVGDIDTGYQFGKLAVKLLDRFDAPPLKVKVLCFFNLFVRHYKEHNRVTLQPLLEAHQCAVETGDLEYAAYSAHHYDEHCFFAGVELSELSLKTATFSQVIRNLKQETVLRYNEMLQQVILNLSGQGHENPCLLVGEAYDEVTMEPLHREAKDGLALFYLNFKKSLLFYLFGNLPQALERAEVAQQYLSSALGMLDVPACYFYDSLVRLAIYPEADASNRPKLLDAVRANQEKIQYWAQYAPINYQHKYDLVEAERNRVLGNKLEAIEEYDRAIAGAQANQYIQEEALANELAGKFYLDWGKEKIAHTYLNDAYNAYSRWGGKAKVEDLEKRYPDHFAAILDQENANFSSAHPEAQRLTSLTSSAFLDLETVMKASGAIAEEIQLDRLLSTLIQVAIENAGAQKGALILYRESRWQVVASATSSPMDNPVLEIDTSLATPLEASQELPLSLIRFAMRSQETVVLTNGSQAEQFAADPYIIARQPQSIFCLPIRTRNASPQGDRALLALLYLENNLVTGAFTHDRVETLQLLATQAAVSLENAQLYAQVETYSQELATQVEERTQSLEWFSASLKQIHRLNTISYDSLETLCQDYLQAGCEIFALPIGAICREEGSIHTFYSVKSDLDGLFPGVEFEQAEGYFAAVHRDRATVAYDRAGEIPALQNNPVYQQFQLESYLGTPIWVEGEIYGTLNFASSEKRSSGWGDRDREIIELMAQSLGKFITTHQTEMRRQQAEASLQQRAIQLRHQNSTLLRLAKHPALNEGDLPTAARAITEVVATSLAERASIWLFSEDNSRLLCLNLCEQTPGRHSQGMELAAADYPAYFQAILTEDIIAANDARRDARTCEFSESYLTPLGITAMLDVPIRSHGQTLGVLCVEQVGLSYCWTPEDETFTRSVADLIALAMEARDRAQSQATLSRQNALLKAQQTASLDGIVITDEHRQIFSYNQQFCQLWQVAEELLTPDRAPELLDRILSQMEEPEVLLSKIKNLYEINPFVSERFEVRLKDGRVFDYYSSPIHSDRNHYYGRIWYVRDITELVTAQINLQRQLFALDSTTNGIALLNAEGEYIYLNQAHVRMFGYKSSDELLGQHWQVIYDDDEFERIEQEVFPLLARDKRWRGEAVAQRQDGSSFDQEVSLSYTDDGLLVCICQDISERKRQEKWLRLMVEGTAASTGEDFFRSCVHSLAEVLQVRYAFIAVFTNEAKDCSKTLAFWAGEDFGENFQYNLAGTPCAHAFDGEICRFNCSIQSLFPEDQDLVTLGAESYVAAPIQDSFGNFIGHLAILHTQPLESDLHAQASILKIFTARVGSEIERQRADDTVTQQMQRVLLLKQVIQDIRESLDPAQILKTTATLLGTTFQASRCLIYGYETDPQPTLPIVARYLAPGCQQALSISAVPIEGNPHAQKLLVRDRAISTPDIYADPQFAPMLPFCEEINLKAILAIRTSYKGQINGVISLHQCDRTRQWTLEEITLFEAVAAQVGIALAQAQLLEQETKQRQELSQKNLALASAKQELESKNVRLKSTLKKLKQTQAQLVQTEKMSGLGQMVAGVAHEINNPVSFIAGNIEHAQMYFQDLLALIQAYQQAYPDSSESLQQFVEEIDLDFLQEDLQKLLHSMRVGSDRIRKIVLSLRNFSRLDEVGMKPVNLHEGIDNTLLILQHRLKDTGRQKAIAIVKEYGTLPLITCYASQLNQVFMNILNNAVDALEEQRHPQDEQNPQIRIRTEVLEGKRVLIRIADNGAGIPEKVRKHLFDPFFTTKPVGKGTGLGLSISYQIVVEEHQGQLTCTSTPTEGTEFAIALPLSLFPQTQLET